MERFSRNLRRTVISGAIIFISSCSSISYKSNYKGEPNYESFYLVDTIIIEKPMRIHSPKFGGQFIVSKKILENYNDKIDFFNRPDVFLLGDDLYRDLPPKFYSRYSYPDNGGCEFVKSDTNVVGLEVYELHETSQTFLLGLINASYFFSKHNSYDSYQFSEKGSKVTYYKIVYPLCR